MRELGSEFLLGCWESASAPPTRKTTLTTKGRFLNGLESIEMWGEDVQTEEANIAEAKFHDIFELYKLALIIYAREIMPDEPNLRIHLETPSLGMFLKFFYLRLARSDIVKTLKFFSPDFLGVEKEHFFMNSLRFALMDCANLAVRKAGTGKSAAALSDYILPKLIVSQQTPTQPTVSQAPTLTAQNLVIATTPVPPIATAPLQKEQVIVPQKQEEEEIEDEYEREREDRRERRRRRKEGRRHKRYEDDEYSEADKAVIVSAQQNPDLQTWITQSPAVVVVPQPVPPQVVGGGNEFFPKRATVDMKDSISEVMKTQPYRQPSVVAVQQQQQQQPIRIPTYLHSQANAPIVQQPQQQQERARNFGLPWGNSQAAAVLPFGLDVRPKEVPTVPLGPQEDAPPYEDTQIREIEIRGTL
jgi:hypothetical protein